MPWIGSMVRGPSQALKRRWSSLRVECRGGIERRSASCPRVIEWFHCYALVQLGVLLGQCLVFNLVPRVRYATRPDRILSGNLRDGEIQLFSGMKELLDTRHTMSNTRYKAYTNMRYGHTTLSTLKVVFYYFNLLFNQIIIFVIFIFVSTLNVT